MRSSVPEDKGYVLRYNVASIAAGTILEVGPVAGITYELVSLRFNFVTDANVAVRSITVSLWDGTQSYGRMYGGFTQAASLTYSYSLIPWWSGIPTQNLLEIYWPWKRGIYLEEPMVVRFDVANIQVGDQFSAIHVYALEWLNDKV
jgi:hypothetical protein